MFRVWLRGAGSNQSGNALRHGDVRRTLAGLKSWAYEIRSSHRSAAAPCVVSVRGLNPPFGTQHGPNLGSHTTTP